MSSKEASSLKGAEPKTKGRGRGRGRGRERRSSSDDRNSKQPFMQEDDFTDVHIVVEDKKCYSNACLLSYSSPVFMKMLADEGKESGKGGKGGKGSSGGNKDKELDLSKYSYDDVCEMVAFIDPRVDTDLTDEVAARLLPIAVEYEIRSLLKACSKTLFDTYNGLRKGRRTGYVSTDITLRYLKLADKYECDMLKDLQECCIEECGTNSNPQLNKIIADDDDLSEQTKRKVLHKRLDHATHALARERRNREQVGNDMRKSTTWKK